MIKKPAKLAKIATLASLTFLVGIGLILVTFEIKPFWVDEWRIIYNLKTKDAAALWGPLELMQQFPRVYLQIVKAFTQYFDFSYSSLRLPAYLLGVATLIFAYRLMQRFYTDSSAVKFLFLLILASSHTFVEYFVQTKQYTMDIFMSMLALWQLSQLLQLKKQDGVSAPAYLLLCATFVVAPFFSYTYPILTAPLFGIAMLQSIFYKPQAAGNTPKTTFIAKIWLPLILCLASLIAFYLLDVARLLQDVGMKIFWHSMTMEHGFHPVHLIKSFYLIFSNVGSGLLFEIIFGITGIAAFLFCIRDYFKNHRSYLHQEGAQLRLYGIVLIGIIIFLFVIGKLPIGEPRLLCYSVPAIAVLIIYLLENLLENKKVAKLAGGLTLVLFLGTIGNIINNQLKNLFSKEHYRVLATYCNMSKGIALAQQRKLPIFVTSAVAYPDEKVINFPITKIRADVLCFTPGYFSSIHFNTLQEIPADWVLKTMPAYKMSISLPVYAIDSIGKAEEYIRQLPPAITSVIAISESTFVEVKR